MKDVQPEIVSASWLFICLFALVLRILYQQLLFFFELLRSPEIACQCRGCAGCGAVKLNNAWLFPGFASPIAFTVTIACAGWPTGTEVIQFAW